MHPICVIGLRPEYTDPRENVSRFDFGVCMAAFDGKTELGRIRVLVLNLGYCGSEMCT